MEGHVIGSPYCEPDANGVLTREYWNECPACNGTGAYRKYGTCFCCEGSGGRMASIRIQTNEGANISKNWLGEIGEKRQESVTLTKIYNSGKPTYAFETSEGDILRWFPRNVTLKDWHVGQEMNITFKVRKHKVYSNMRQTVISLVKQVY